MAKALDAAAKKGSASCMIAILKAAAGGDNKVLDVGTALADAARFSHADCVTLLIADAPAPATATAMSLASTADVMTAFLRAGISPDTQVDNQPVLYLLAERGYADAMPALLDAGAKVDGVGEFVPILSAAAAGHLDTIKVLVQHGAKTTGAYEQAVRYHHDDCAGYLKELGGS
jgi:ankyrin repeat protein